MQAQEHWFSDHFTAVSPDALRALNGDAVMAVVLCHIRFRMRSFGQVREGREWWTGTAQEIADWTGLGRQQVQRAIVRLERCGVLQTHAWQDGGPYDRTLSYSLVLSEAAGQTEESCAINGPIAGEQSTLIAGDYSSLQEDQEELPLVRQGRTTAPAPSPEGAVRGSVTPAEQPSSLPFEEFWARYPGRRKQAKASCEDLWKRLSHEHRLATLARLAEDTVSADWRDPQYIPAPLVWLRKKRWLDDEGPGRSDIRTVQEALNPYGVPLERWTIEQQRAALEGRTFADLSSREMLQMFGRLVAQDLGA